MAKFNVNVSYQLEIEAEDGAAAMSKAENATRPVGDGVKVCGKSYSVYEAPSMGMGQSSGPRGF